MEQIIGGKDAQMDRLARFIRQYEECCARRGLARALSRCAPCYAKRPRATPTRFMTGAGVSLRLPGRRKKSMPGHGQSSRSKFSGRDDSYFLRQESPPGKRGPRA